VTDERRRLLETIGRKGKDRAALIAELGAGFGVDSALRDAIDDRDVRVQVIEPIDEVGLPQDRDEVGLPQDRDSVFVLTEQGAAKVGIDPDLVGMI
jgi:hypothetical protein